MLGDICCKITPVVDLPGRSSSRTHFAVLTDTRCKMIRPWLFGRAEPKATNSQQRTNCPLSQLVGAVVSAGSSISQSESRHGPTKKLYYKTDSQRSTGQCDEFTKKSSCPPAHSQKQRNTMYTHKVVPRSNATQSEETKIKFHLTEYVSSMFCLYPKLSSVQFTESQRPVQGELTTDSRLQTHLCEGLTHSPPSPDRGNRTAQRQPSTQVEVGWGGNGGRWTGRRVRVEEVGAAIPALKPRTFSPLCVRSFKGGICPGNLPIAMDFLGLLHKRRKR